MVLILACITLIYLFVIGFLAYGIDKIDLFVLEDIKAETRFSVIVPFRNEAENLQKLMDSIGRLNYSRHLYEIILVDDASTDNSIELIKKALVNKPSKSNLSQLDIKIIANVRKTYSPKKDAINAAINVAKYEWIVTTDADCVLPKYWLDAFDNFIQKVETEFIVAPVTYSNCDSFFKRFQLLDFLSMQGVTIGGFGIKNPILCNGANLAYKKSLFEALDGFKGNSEIASGDDIFLLEKASKKTKQKVHYLKSQQVIVYTSAQKTIRDLIAQRKRWASKASQYKNTLAIGVGLSVLLMNASLICAFILTLANSLDYPFLLYISIIKIAIDFLVIFKTSRFFNQENVLPSYVLSSILYPFFSVYIAVASMFSKYKWKGRAFTK